MNNKTLLCLFFIALAATFALADDDDSRNVTTIFSGTWYSTGVYNPEDIEKALCCVPIGTIAFEPTEDDDKSMTMNATEWAGALCDQMGITSETEMKVPFGRQFKYLGEIATVKGLVNEENIGFHIWNINTSYTFPKNHSQIIQLDLYMDYSNAIAEHSNPQGVECGVRISKAASVLKAGAIAILGLLAVFIL